MTEQLELQEQFQQRGSLFKVEPDSAAVGRLLAVLELYGWQKRARLAKLMNCTERDIRALAEAAGPDVIRGQKGLNHIANASVDDLVVCGRQSMSQGKHMIKLGIAWLRVAHGRVG